MSMFDSRSKIYKEEIRKNIEGREALLHSLQGKCVAVIGATGLIGSAMVDFLCVADTILDLSLSIYAAGRNQKAMEERFCGMPVSLLAYDACQEIDWEQSFDLIFQCAGNSGPKAIGDEPVETLLSNILGIKNLVEYLQRKNPACRIVFLSTGEIYGTRADEDATWYDEEHYYHVDILNPRSSYPSGKRAAETLCVSYVKEYDMDMVIARVGHVYGPQFSSKDSRVFAQFFQDAIEGRDIVMKSLGLQLRTYCYIWDCVTALITIALKGNRGEAYNVSNRHSVVTIRDLATTIAAQSGKQVLYEEAATQESRNFNAMTISALDAAKLEAMGWCGRYSLEEGVKQTLLLLNQ